MASITFKGRSSEVLRTYKEFRIGSDVNAKDLDFCLQDPSVAKLHATLTRSEAGLYLVNESRFGRVYVNGELVGGVTLLTFRDSVKGIIELRFGQVEATLRISGNLIR